MEKEPEDKREELERPVRTSEEIKAEIEDRFGFFPPFFEPALEAPEVLANLWQQTLFAYVNNPLPALFKEKLFAHLSRYCAVPYCIVCHSCALRPLGMTSKEVLDLIEHATPLSEKELEKQLSILTEEMIPLTSWPKTNSNLEKSLLHCSIYIFLKPDRAQPYRTAIRSLIGEVNYAHLSAFLFYIKTCHIWVETHPEISYEIDKRVQDNLAPLIKDNPSLSNFFRTYNSKVRYEMERQEKQLIAEMKELKQVEEALLESIRRNESLLQAMPDMMFVLTREGTYVDIKADRNDDLAIPPSEIIGMNIRDAGFSEDYVKLILEGIERTLATGKIQTFEYELKTPRGLGIYEARVVPLNEDEVLANVRNITERKRAEDEIHQSREQLRALAARLQAIREEERAKISRELHDELGHTLTALKIDLTSLSKDPLFKNKPRADDLQSMISLTSNSLQTLKRISTELRPGVLDQLGLSAAIEWQLREFQSRTQIKCVARLPEERLRLSKDKDIALFRILQETLTNITRHTQATNVSVTLEKVRQSIFLTTKDNGRGIKESEVTDMKSLGLLGMRERAHLVGGELTITGEEGKGTTVSVSVPID